MCHIYLYIGMIGKNVLPTNTHTHTQHLQKNYTFIHTFYMDHVQQSTCLFILFVKDENLITLVSGYWRVRHSKARNTWSCWTAFNTPWAIPTNWYRPTSWCLALWSPWHWKNNACEGCCSSHNCSLHQSCWLRIRTEVLGWGMGEWG